MASSADVAAHAGVSRSTVSQILNGHGHRFKPEMVDRVKQVAQELGYRPSVAGRTLARGTSDIVITLIPNITFAPRLREFVDVITAELARAGKTNLLRLASSDDDLEDAILGLRPAGILSLSPLSPDMRARLDALKVHVVEAPQELQVELDRAIGALQAEHLHACGYDLIAIAQPLDHRERPFAVAREAGTRDWCLARGIPTAPTLYVPLERDANVATARALPRDARVGIAAYNDDIALAVLGAATLAHRDVPGDLGIIGVDNSTASRVSVPTITTVDIDVAFSAHPVVEALTGAAMTAPDEEFGGGRNLIHVVAGGSTATAGK